MKKFFCIFIALVLIGVLLFYHGQTGVVKESRDESQNIVLVDSVPYYGYIEASVWDKNINARLSYSDSMYTPKDNADFLVCDYLDGVCIMAYVGSDVNVVIPEMIDGKKVIKLGNWFDISSQELNSYTAFYDPNEPIAIESVHLPSSVKEIVLGTFFDNRDNLKKITVSKENPYYFSFAGMLFSKEKNKLLCAPIIDYYCCEWKEIQTVDGQVLPNTNAK